MFLTLSGLAQFSPNYEVGTASGNYNFSYQQIPEPLKEILPVTAKPDPTAQYYYQWQSSASPLFNGYQNIGNSTTGDYTYTFTQPLAQTTYFRVQVTRVSTAAITSVFSNTIKISVVSINWENHNYIREHDVLTQGITDWKTIDQMTIGTEQKLQTTTYFDGLNRPLENLNKGIATPASGNTVWGDQVEFSQYDQYERQPKGYLPYTTANNTELGKFKTQPINEQSQYYATVYNETSPFNNITYDNSPLNRDLNVKESGTSWANASGNSTVYDLNNANDSVEIIAIGYATNAVPTVVGYYPVNSLFRNVYTDENGKNVIEYADQSGLLILKKVQIADNATSGDAGWICTYNVYDDFNRLRFVLQPEAVKYFDENGWNFNTTNAATVINNMCFQYVYDSKGRNIEKKAPGAKQLNMIYDKRDHMVFTEDGNQADLAVPQWTAYIYDELDRQVIAALYNPSETIAQLQIDANNAGSLSTVTTTTTGGPIVNLVVDNRNTSIASYTAQNTIQFVTDAGGSFSTAPGDNFAAYIDPNATAPSVTTTTTVRNLLIPLPKFNDPSVTTVIKYDFYDGYTYTGVKSFDNNFNNTLAYANSDANILPIATDARTLDQHTGSSTRVLGTNTFLACSYYFDERGNQIQSLEDNILQGQDVTTKQYHWDGRLLSTFAKHSTAGTGYTNFTTLTKNIFDQVGRITGLQKTYGSNAPKTIAIYSYDDMGRLLNKTLDPNYQNPTTGNNYLESLGYTYNIHGQITGVNKDYALKKPGLYKKWNNYFGYYLGYDNKDNNFNKAQLDGHVSGGEWSTQGDDVQRKFDYNYDDAGRLVNATYNEKQNPTDPWSNATMDFSVNGINGNIQYDLNGNLLSMLQKGVVPGQSPITVDDLHYTYESFSNKLLAVTDNTTSIANGTLGDFKDGSNGTANDYNYDDNGNLIQDLNKGVVSDANNTQGITYNFLDKPVTIRIPGKGTIQIVYDANGNKLQKIFIPDVPTSGTIPNQVTMTYINEYVYQQSTPVGTSGGAPTLSYIDFEEGRIRIIKPVNQSDSYSSLNVSGNLTMPNDPSGGGGAGVFDYYILDYQENVRMVLTEETSFSSATCTMETNRSAIEEATFGQPGANNEVEKTRFAAANIPGQSTGQGWQPTTAGPIGNSVSMLESTDGSTPAIGPNSLLKVMAGDQISASVQYYYQNYATNGNNDNTTTFTTNLVGALIQAISSGTAAAGGLSHEGTTMGNIQAQLNSSAPFTTFTSPDANNSMGGNPKAYLTILFFDERFNFIPPAADGSGSSIIRIQDGVAWQSDLTRTLANIKAPKNGYAYIYVSNESSQPVYFDNLKVSDNQGSIIEEDHYYAYGLKIAAISSTKIDEGIEGTLKNNYLYNDKELWDDGSLGWYDYGFRNYDAQIGRFTQLDPLTFGYHELTPYQYASCEPIANVDMDGLELFGVTTPGGFWNGSFLVEKSVSSGLNLSSAFLNTATSVLSVLANVGNVASAFEEAKSWGKNLLDPDDPELNITFEGDAKDDVYFTPNQKGEHDDNQIGIGEVHIRDADGNDVEEPFSAVSGPDGNGLLPNGDYDASLNLDYTEKKPSNSVGFQDETGASFKLSLTPKKIENIPEGKKFDRENLLIHSIPGGQTAHPVKGTDKTNYNSRTHGCIGINGGHAAVVRFWKRVGKYLKKHGTINVHVQINGNKDVYYQK